MATRLRADLLLVERGLMESREEAKRLILAGKVFAQGQRVSKPSDIFAADAVIVFQEKERFVSRGGEKLDSALQFFKLDVTGALAIDLGASTGGFTDCLLQRGASKVYAVDVGHGQLAEKMRQDARVVVLERQNARYLKPSDFSGPADIVTMDVSFISLTKILPAAFNLLRVGGHLVALIKPQFEAGRSEVKKGGVVKSEEIRQRVVEEMKKFASETLRANILGICTSPLLGPAGNKEFLMGLQK